MIKIHTILANGQFLHPLVMAGAIENNAAIVPITGDKHMSKRIDEKCVAENWRKAISTCRDNVFIGMDSDVILTKGCVSYLIDSLILHKVEMANIESIRDTYRKHGIWAVKMSYARYEQPKFQDYDHCPLCLYFKGIHNKIILQHEPLLEAPRDAD
jgi:hypothetical protein